MKKVISLILCVFMLGGCFAYADTIEGSRTVIGADLDEEDIAFVYKQFGIERGDVKELSVTNAEEREYLKGLVDESLIGSRSISCIYIEALSEGKGLDVTVKNITWCTPDMYMNAMVTAGITDANVKIAAPFEVSGTAALTGIYKAYEDITGKKLDEDAKLVGTKELTITAELAEEIGSADSAAIVNELKLILDQTKDMSDEELRAEIIKIAEQYDVNLNDSQIDQLISLCRSMEKLDIQALKDKVEQVQKYLQDIVKTHGEVKQFLSTVAVTVTEFVNKIVDFFKGIFG